MVFVETPMFVKQALEELPDDELRQIQALLFAGPTAVDPIHGTGGVRKLRWKGSGRGKRGGVRIIYYWHAPKSRIYLLLMYPKNVQDDLTRDQIATLRKLVKEIV
ncbi:MAG: type II toxin-antitoxin system RelE/ParE family toxin [Desulfomonilaceae bacterium]|nr:type II toxin-antitoxin system RelE/ParE family toxin [Desulfomonilaceae bacterium]